MPLYEFECEECKTRWERIQKFTDPNPEACPTCGKGPVRKLPSSPAIQFKGSGFYITDYAKKSSPDASSGSKPGESKSGGDGKSESKSGDSGSSSSTESKSTDTKSTDSTAKSSPAKD